MLWSGGCGQANNVGCAQNLNSVYFLVFLPMSSLYQFNMNKSHFVLFVFLLLYAKFNSAIDCESVYVTCVENRNIKNATVQETHRKCVDQSGITAKQFDRLGHTLSEQLRRQKTELKEPFTKEIEEKDTRIAELETELKEEQSEKDTLTRENDRCTVYLKEQQARINAMKYNNITQKAKLHDQQMARNGENDKSMATLKEKEHKPINATQATSCRDYPNSDGIETIRVPGMDSFEVLCNSRIAGEGWTVIMRKYRNSINFDKTWNEYKNGFGDLSDEFWIGLEKLHLMTKFHSHEIHIDRAYRNIGYTNFTIANEADAYKILTTGYRHGGRLNFLATKTDVKFTTTDRDNDNDTVNCAHEIKIGWWFDKCSGPFDQLYKDFGYTVMIRPTN